MLFDNYSQVVLAACCVISVGYYLPSDCQDHIALGNTTTGIYTIYPEGSSPYGFNVRCDMDTDHGGWTVIQRRVFSSDFYHGWTDYMVGFGNLANNFWLGNQQIALITAQGWYELRVDLTNPSGVSRYAGYQLFKVGSFETKYKLSVGGYYGTAGDSLGSHNNAPFTTYDQDNDVSTSNCAVTFSGALWYRACHSSNLNGLYGNTNYGKGLNWKHMSGFYVSMTTTEMKIRRWRPRHLPLH